VQTEKIIIDDIIHILKDVGKIEGEILPESDIYTELGVESVNSISILLALEDKFSIAIDDNQFIQARTLTKLTQLVRASK